MRGWGWGVHWGPGVRGEGLGGTLRPRGEG